MACYQEVLRLYPNYPDAHLGLAFELARLPGRSAEAIAHLERAIALNPENRALARQDPDLEPLREDEAFRSALEASALPRSDRRRPFRTRSVR